jgi:hypothetical protein
MRTFLTAIVLTLTLAASASAGGFRFGFSIGPRYSYPVAPYARPYPYWVQPARPYVLPYRGPAFEFGYRQDLRRDYRRW